MARRGGGHRPSRRSSRSSFHSSSSSRHHYHRRRHYSSYDGDNSYFYLIRIVISLVVCFFALVYSTPDFDVVTYQKPRIKVEPAAPYQPDCVIDQAGFFTQPSYIGRQLEEFYTKTGVQPIIFIHEYDANLTSDYAKEAWTTSYYDTYVENETCFLLVYFLEKNPSDMGYFAYANGHLTDSLMDSGAIRTFWKNIDKYWMNSSLTAEEELISAFHKTAEQIMSNEQTVSDRNYMLYVGIGIVILFLIFHFINKKGDVFSTRKGFVSKADETSDDYLDNYMG